MQPVRLAPKKWQRLVSIVVVGGFAITCGVVYIAQLHSEADDSAPFGGAALVGLMVFWLLGWTTLPPLRRRR
jgi:hypothetical protein